MSDVTHGPLVFLHIVVLLLLHSIIYIFFIGYVKRSLQAENFININFEKKKIKLIIIMCRIID